MASPKHLQFKSQKKLNHYARVLEVFVGICMRSTRKYSEKQKNEKDSIKQTLGKWYKTVLQSLIVSSEDSTFKTYHHSCSQILDIEPAWKLPTFFEVNE